MTGKNKLAAVLASISTVVLTMLVCLGGLLAVVSLPQLDAGPGAVEAAQPADPPEAGLDVDGSCKHRIDLQNRTGVVGVDRRCDGYQPLPRTG